MNLLAEVIVGVLYGAALDFQTHIPKGHGYTVRYLNAAIVRRECRRWLWGVA